MKNHIVSFSSGLSSAVTAIRVMERYGKENTQLVFMDTKFEDDDNYRFMIDFERMFDVEILRLADGRTPYQVASDEHVIFNNRVASCTRRLKIELFQRWLKSLSYSVTVHIGYDYTEMHRIDATTAAYEKLGVTVDYPLLWKPYEIRTYIDVMRSYGIEAPRMYSMGYTHANCGGRCVKQGHGDWLRTLINFPERFAEIEQWEREMRDHPVRKNYAILKTQTKDGFEPLTLEELRIENQDRLSLPLLCALDEQSACVHCGVL